MDQRVRKDIEKRLLENFRWYLDNQDKLVENYNGKHLVIVDKNVVDAYDNHEDSYFGAVEKYGLGNFSLQKCSPGEQDTTLHVKGFRFPVNPIQA
jgi:hypothetical protein